MFKALLISTLIISALSSYNFDLDDIVNVQEGDIQLLYDLYLQYLAPSEITLSAERYSNFKADVLEIIEHNNNPANSWKKGLTQFTGMTLEELKGISIMAEQNCSATNGVSAKGLHDLPDFLDWREKGVVSAVKNQLKCGSCWTFSSTGALEAHFAIQNDVSPPSFSEQQLVDCAQAFDNNGCKGGLPSHAFEYLKYAGGIETEEAYPYTAKDEECKFNKASVAARVPFGSHNITLGDEEALKEALALYGPVSVAYEVTKDFKDYKSGIYVGATCRQRTDTVNHAVLAVGYGTDEKTGMDYWIVKNSWGEKFGENGYFKIQRGVNMCGIAVCASYPLLNRSMK